MELATRGERFASALADGVLVAVPYVLATIETLPSAVRLLGTAGTLALLVTQIYLLSTTGQTIGKRLLGIRIVLKDSLKNGGFVVNVLKRGLVNGLLSLIPGYFLVDSLFIFREDRRCIHDLIAATCVIKGSAVGASVVQ